MRTFAFTAALLILSQLYKSQDTPKRFEFGSTLLTINSLKEPGQYRQDRPSNELFNGLFFRYNLKRASIRAFTSYTGNHFSYAAPKHCRDCESGEVDSKDFRLGLGLQYSLLKNKEWVYLFIDLAWRNLFSMGTYKGGFAGWESTFSSSNNGVDSFYGAGFKIKVYKRIYLSPEFGYNIYYGLLRMNMEDTYSKKKSYTKTYTSTENYMAKLHLTIKF
jgi:hypothetical protein